jgi:hypothetical protein
MEVLPNQSARVTSTGERRTLVRGAFGILAILALGHGIPRLREWRSTQLEAAALLANTHREALSATQRLSGIRDSLNARNVRYLALAPRVLPGRTAGAAAAGLTAMVTGAATGANVRIGSVQALPVGVARRDTLQAFRRVRVRFAGTGDLIGLQRMLLTLERGPLLLHVRELSIIQAAVNASDDQPDALEVAIVVEGLAIRHRTDLADLSVAGTR